MISGNNCYKECNEIYWDVYYMNEHGEWDCESVCVPLKNRLIEHLKNLVDGGTKIKLEPTNWR